MPQSPSTPKRNTSRDGFTSTPYETLKAGKPPIPITVAPTPSSVRLDLHPSLRPRTSPEPSLNGVAGITPRSKLRDDIRRDSGMADSNSTTRESRQTFTTDTESAASIKKSQSLPRIKDSITSSPPSAKRFRRWSGGKTQQKVMESPDKAPRLPETPFTSHSSDIPTISFDDLTLPDKIEFSKRGSMLIGGKKANETRTRNGESFRARSNAKPQRQSNPTVPSTPVRVLSPDEESLSRKVRSMYENMSYENISSGEMPVVPETTSVSSYEGRELAIEEDPSEQDNLESQRHVSNLTVPSQRPASSIRSRRSFVRGDSELAGGIEDWQDVRGEDVDRYGFINPKPVTSNNASSNSLPSPGQLHRVSTVLQLASDAPRRQSSRLGRSSSTAKSARAAANAGPKSGPAQRPVSSQSSYKSAASARSSKVRSAANRLPYNRQRRFVDEAGDMLTLPPGLADIAEHEEGGKVADMLKKKEWEREAKWRKMAKVVKSDKHGGGMKFSFDTTNSKLIERTWKGIPDSWRGSAWHAFLSASAKKRPGSATDEELISSFHELLDQSSPDDVQIDIDVPRTISSHIMFRKRYRGGQRLLFRVLHCLSIYFPDTGYVQGMAALAATFLCYYDEEMAFVMLVRMWQLRGLDRLYKAGFEGLMQALDEFDKGWLKNGAVGKKLTNLGISPTAYGTRWYLTVFNYSIPFPAQLRVWDVFMLLGDANPVGPNSTTSYNGGLDVLHATSAALIDGTREILLDSDFENAMKVLTSWIPIRDEEMLMRVAKVEWKAGHRKRK